MAAGHLALVVLHVTLLTLHVDVTSGGGTLFGWDEPLAQLHAVNFTRHVANSETAWIVEFYATWCGHCQKFAPYWSALAVDVEGWSSVVRVGAVACSNTENSALCRLYNIWGYPTVKLFPPYASLDYKGHDYSGGKNVSAIRAEIITYLQSVAMAPPTWPALEPDSSFESIERRLHDKTRIYVVMEDPEDELQNPVLGRELILDATSLEGVGVARMLRSRALSHGVEVFPSLYRLRRGQLVYLASGLDREGFYDVIVEDIPEEEDPEGNPDPTQRGIPTDGATSSPATPVPGTRAPPAGLHRRDLDGMLRYALTQEVATHARVTGPALSALKNYVHVMAKYFPGDPATMAFLAKIQTKLRYKTETEVLTGREWQQILRSQTQDARLPEASRWASCAGSEARYRGYPCSVWMTFHTLTVAAYQQALRRDPREEFSPTEVLVVMREYVRHFLGCRACAEHFTHMAANLEHEVRSAADAVKWLWRSHNLVNQRLQGDATEDPAHPKIQFPAPADCPQCRRVIQGRYGAQERWIEDAVLTFLLEFYSTADIAGDPGHSSASSGTRPAPAGPTTLLHAATLLHGGGVTTPTTLQAFRVTFSPSRWRPRRPRPRPRPRLILRKRTQTPEPETTPLPQATPSPDTELDPRRQPDRASGHSNKSTDWGDLEPDVTPSPEVATGSRSEALEAGGVELTRDVVDVRRSNNRTETQSDRVTFSTTSDVVTLTTASPSVPTVFIKEPYNSCELEASDWSACSTSCGTGLSTRMSNHNGGCRMQLEARLCNLRPCQAVYSQPAVGSCGATYRTYGRQNLRYGTCRSVRFTRWRYCGLCDGKCCRPVTSDTRWLEMVCYYGDRTLRGYMQVEIINLCECSEC